MVIVMNVAESKGAYVRFKLEGNRHVEGLLIEQWRDRYIVLEGRESSFVVTRLPADMVKGVQRLKGLTLTERVNVLNFIYGNMN